MPQQIAVERYTTELFAFLDETFERVGGLYLDRGTSLFETLATVSAADASCPVSATCASIAAQVEHVRFYLDVIDRSLRGETIGPIDWDATWTLTSVTDEEWDALRQRLRDTYRSLRQTITDVESWDDAHDIGDPLAAIVHTAYHLGEIRQALCTVGS
jgi:hypothetical protein